MKDKDNGMILYNIKNILGITEIDFRVKVLGEKAADVTSNPTYWANIVKGDYLTKNKREAAEKALRNRIQWQETVQNIVLRKKKELVEGMLDVLKNKELRYAKSNPTSHDKNCVVEYCEYDASVKRWLLEQLEKLQDEEVLQDNDVLYIAWCIVSFAVSKYLPSVCTNDMLQKQYDEYISKVMKLYGGMMIPAQRAIVELESKGNVVAANALGEIFYNGRFSGGKPQYKKAYEKFREAAGDLEGTNSLHYPLACWNVAYMLFNYRFRRELKSGVMVKEIECMSRENRVRYAIKYCILAIQRDDTCVPAYNLLGVILDSLETEKDIASVKSDITEDDFLRQRLGNNITPEVFFEIASESGYVEGFNNLWRRECKLAFQKKAPAEERKHLQQALSHLESSAALHCAWANNKLGEFYRTGKMNIFYEELDKLEVREYPDMINLNKARGYYIEAVDCFIDKHSAWAAFHLLESFYGDLEAEDLVKCHDVIKNANNKEVYEKYSKWKKEWRTK